MARTWASATTTSSRTNPTRCTISELQNVVIPQGALGTPAGVPVPSQGISLQQGKQTLLSSGTMIAQPLTQLLRIHQENRVAAAEIATSQDELKKAENRVALQVHAWYFSILVTQLQRKAAEQETSFAAESLRENKNDVRNGSALHVAEIQSRAELLETNSIKLKNCPAYIREWITRERDASGD